MSGFYAFGFLIMILKVYCHHHSKGGQGMKKAMDRASGSGVFARDPDAQLDIIELEMTEEVDRKSVV